MASKSNSVKPKRAPAANVARARAAPAAKPSHNLLLRSTLLKGAVGVATHQAPKSAVFSRLDALASAAKSALLDAETKDVDFVPSAPLPPLVFPSSPPAAAPAAAAAPVTPPPSPVASPAAVPVPAASAVPTVNDTALIEAINEHARAELFGVSQMVEYTKPAILYASTSFSGQTAMHVLSGHETVICEFVSRATQATKEVLCIPAVQLVLRLLTGSFISAEDTCKALFSVCDMSVSLFDVVFFASGTRDALGGHLSRMEMCRLLGQTQLGASGTANALQALMSKEGLRIHGAGGGIAYSHLAILHSLARAGLIVMQLVRKL